MYQKEFIPVVFKVNFKSEKNLTVEKWQELIGKLLKNYAQSISENKDCFIGHIKALAEIADVSFIKFSCVNALAEVNSEFHGDRQSVHEVNMVVNSLVTNTDSLKSRRLLNQAFIQTGNQKENILMNIEDETSEPLREHHHHQKDESCPICNGHHHHNHDLH